MKPIPVQMLSHTATLQVPDAVGVQQDVLSMRTRELRRVCIQTASATNKARDNTTEARTATMFVDARLSWPRLDWWKLKQDADQAGGDLVVLHGDRRYLVREVHPIQDDHARLHHYEVMLV